MHWFPGSWEKSAPLTNTAVYDGDRVGISRTWFDENRSARQFFWSSDRGRWCVHNNNVYDGNDRGYPGVIVHHASRPRAPLPRLPAVDGRGTRAADRRTAAILDCAPYARVTANSY